MSRQEHEELLTRLERETDIALMRLEADHMELREGLVRKYGEDGVLKVENKIRKDWEARISSLTSVSLEAY